MLLMDTDQSSPIPNLMERLLYIASETYCVEPKQIMVSRRYGIKCSPKAKRSLREGLCLTLLHSYQRRLLILLYRDLSVQHNGVAKDDFLAARTLANCFNGTRI